MADRRADIRLKIDRLADDQLISDADRSGIARVIAD